MTVADAALPLADIRRSLLARVADALAVAVAVFLPWLTSAVGIFVALWLVVSLPLFDLGSLRRELASAPGALPIVLVILAIFGMSWSDVSLMDRSRGVEPFLRLLMIPILFAQFRRSRHGAWVGVGFLASATALLATSFAMVAAGFDRGRGLGVPVKDYVSQSGMFVLCGFALFDFAVARFRAGQRIAAGAGAGLALLFFADIAYVNTSRTTLVVIPVLYALWGCSRLSGTALARFLIAGLVVGALAWIAAPNVSGRLIQISTEIAVSRDTGTVTSSGSRLGFWKNSLLALGEAPVLGHGTGTIPATFGRLGGPDAGPAATNPHNEIFAVGIQLGSVGIVVLLAMWAAHWRLFLKPGLIAWIGLAAVTQNIVGSLFNSHLMDFTQSWLYVFAVGVHGGMLFRQQQGVAADDASMSLAPQGPPSPSPPTSRQSSRQ